MAEDASQDFAESLKSSSSSLLVEDVHTVSPRALRIAVHQLPSCPHSPGLTQSGLRAKADRLLEGEPAPIWNITGSEVQLQPAPVPVLSHVKWPGFFFLRSLTVEPRHKQRLTETKTKAAHYLP